MHIEHPMCAATCSVILGLALAAPPAFSEEATLQSSSSTIGDLQFQADSAAEPTSDDWGPGTGDSGVPAPPDELPADDADEPEFGDFEYSDPSSETTAGEFADEDVPTADGATAEDGAQAFAPTIASNATGGNCNLASAQVTLGSYYTSSISPITPKPQVKLNGQILVLGTDYQIEYKNNVNPGTAWAIISGKGRYTGSKKVSFKLVNLGDDLARQACRLSYSRPAYANAGNGHKGGFKGTTQYKATLKKLGWWDQQVGRACHKGMVAALRSSGYRRGYRGSVEEEYYVNPDAKHRKAKSNTRWKYIGKLTNVRKKGQLRPGDIIETPSGTSGWHTCMYVGKTIPREIYNNYLKGRGKKGGDLKAPTSDTAYVSAHNAGGLNKVGSAALCMGNAKYAGANRKCMRVYRCVAPSRSKLRAGKPVVG